MAAVLSTNTCLRIGDLVSTGIGEDGLALIMDALVANSAFIMDAHHGRAQRSRLLTILFMSALGNSDGNAAQVMRHRSIRAQVPRPGL